MTSETLGSQGAATLPLRQILDEDMELDAFNRFDGDFPGSADQAFYNHHPRPNSFAGSKGHHLTFDDDEGSEDASLLTDIDEVAGHNSDEATQHLFGSEYRARSASLFSLSDSIPMVPLSSTQAQESDLGKKVSFFNGLTLVIGLIIGSGLFSSPGPVLAHSHAVGTSLIIWVVSGLLAMTGALCYAELGTMLPVNGGESVYLERGFGSLVSFLFGFVAIMALKPGSVAIIAVIFGEYLSRIVYHAYFFDTPDNDPSTSPSVTHPADDIIPGWLPKLLACACVITVSLINGISVKWGTRVQDVFTALKIVALLVIVATGIVVLARDGQSVGDNFDGNWFDGYQDVAFSEYALALYSGLWAYDGWNNLNYVSGEMKNPHRDLPRVILFGIPIVIVLYLLANVAYYVVLPASVVTKTNTVALDFGKKLFGPAGGIAFAVIVAAANGSVFTGSRIIYASARQNHFPAVFGRVSSTRQTPQAALALQCALTIVMIIPGTFERLVNFYSVAAWLFYFLAVLALLSLRRREPNLKRPYKTFIITPIIFCAVTLFLLVMPFISAPLESLAALVFVALGIPVWWLFIRPSEIANRSSAYTHSTSSFQAILSRLHPKHLSNLLPNLHFPTFSHRDGYQKQEEHNDEF
ncbi:hypothetical protein BZG36_00542 [Bifiguratus adelaidae]|uniref:Amino acid permease/ SLC12A domain-containing protein n=1 Tax=Bifiguratus adelaidae TaxID=1938954 RepID=A0A261Y725_9FUNG|nr:hypothetical protein BZG36_00542 [Bifiguratus adelaidae]